MDADFRVGQWLVQPQLNLIQGPGGDTPLEPKAMEVLVCLSQQAGEVVPKERLMQTVWSDTFVTDEVLTNSIWELRKAFGDDAKKPKVIQTVFKKGYRLIAPVSFEGKATEVRSILKQSQPESAARSRRPSAGRWIGVAGALLAVTLGIAFSLRSLRQVETVPSEAPRVVPLTSFPGREIQPTFSPDGNQVAFAWNGEKEENFDIYVKLIGSEKLLHLTNDPSVELSPAWSPDGKSIAFIRHSQTHTSIILIPALGGLERELYSVEAWALPVQALQRLLSWSPDGKLLAVCEPAMAKQKQRARISLLSMETRVRRVLVSSDTNPVLAYWNPNFSPDGRALAYVASTSPTVGNIHSVPLAGGEPRQLTSRNRRISGFDWLGNGRGLLFAETQALWKIPVAGGRPEQLNWAGSQVFSPAVSRNGNSLVFERGLVDVNIWKLEVVGTSSSPEKRTPLISSTYLDDHPQLSPDGKKIAFASTRSGDPEIWVCEADGSGQFRLTSIGAHDTATPRWSPDGRSIAFHSNLNGNLDIYVVSLGSGELRRSTTEASDEVRPSWSKNGRWIYFGSNRSGEWQVWKVPAAGGQAEQVTKRGGREAFESLDGKFVCYTKFVIPELWRVPAEGGDEVLLLHGPRQGYWAPVNDGICFLANEPTSIIKLYNFGTKLTTELATVEKPIPWGGSGFSVSPDGKQILYSQIDRTLETDLMLVENFH